jgi:hypothetical protein
MGSIHQVITTEMESLSPGERKDAVDRLLRCDTCIMYL